MADARALTAAERQFLGLVTQAALTNPFGGDRARVDAAIAGLPAGAPPDRVLAAALARIRAELRRLAEQGCALGAMVAPGDERLLRNAHLFDVFHRLVDDFDALIARQVEAGPRPLRVAFGLPAIELMTERGFAAADAARYFAMFYQLRRAFYFVQCSLVGRSPSMQALRLALWHNVFTHDAHLYEQHLWNRMEDFSTLLLGETGTGKGAAATAIGRSGFIPYNAERACFAESFMATFTAINLSQFSESLIESELFGHRKGAFTGAVEAHEGVLARCSPHGAIFLDEIGEVSAPVQIKLLRVLEDRVFSPVGSHEAARFQGRIIAASNRDLRERRRQGLFRDDFYYRLCSDVIVVPPLRDRIREDPGELDDLLSLTVQRIVGHPAPDLAAIVRDAIARELGPDYPWPGNVRELAQCARRVLLTRRYAGDRPPPPATPRDSLVADIDAGALTAQDLVARYCALLYRQEGTYEGVARRTGLDRRTVKKNVLAAGGAGPAPAPASGRSP